MAINSKVKGKVGELDFCHFVKDLGYPCERSQQFKGNTDSADVISPIFEHVHPEVKRVEKINFYEAFHQADKDSGDNIPVVFHRRNRGRWMAFLEADFLIELLELYNNEMEKHSTDRG